MRNLNTLEWIALVLTIVGGINWGLVGAFNFDLVAGIFGAGTTATRIVYVVVGLAAIYALVLVATKRETRVLPSRAI